MRTFTDLSEQERCQAGGGDAGPLFGGDKPHVGSHCPGIALYTVPMTSNDPNGSQATTRGVQVTVHSKYEEEQSDPANDRFLFSYRVRVENGSDETVQLISRRWVVTDGDGEEEVVEGPGVVGQQPVLPPGGSFEYSSFCPLTTMVGAMQGSYWMVSGDGESFEAEIAPFTLSVPGAVN